MSGTGRRSHGSILGVGDVRLAFRACEAVAPKAALVIVHGLGEHSGRYDEFASSMAGSGISSYALDLRGHGQSEGRRGHVPAFDVWLQEVDRFRSEAEGLAGGGVPLFLLGQSMGGLIALRYMEEYPGAFRGAVICSPWLATAMAVPRWKTLLAPVMARFAPALPFPHGLDPDHLSRDPAVAVAYRNDPLAQPSITPRAFAEVAHAMGQVLQRSDRIRAPLLFLMGDADSIVDTDSALRFARSLAAPDVTVRVRPGALHELLHETDRHLVFREIREWVMARV
jgi:alpha-beta hydrolase superfamily lysophospholipase